MGTPGVQTHVARSDASSGSPGACADKAVRVPGIGEVKVLSLPRNPFPYATTARIDQVDATAPDGFATTLLLKRFGNAVRSPRPRFMRDPLRERAVYLSLGPHLGTRAPACYGTVRDENGGCWLVLERLGGRPLWQTDDEAAWCAAARSAAVLHSRGARLNEEDRRQARLGDVSRERGFRWLERLEARVAHDLCLSSLRVAWTHARAAIETALELVLDAPPTLAHGELYPSNVIVDEPAVPNPRSDRGSVPSIRLVDWESALWATGLIDLAALTAGRCAPELRGKLERAYLETARLLGGDTMSDSRFSATLWACRVQQAVQWLTWSDGWEPPEEHRHDWQAELLRLIRESPA
jgi:thiamine kinase-like enzyme